jgi:hypothetical protein
MGRAVERGAPCWGHDLNLIRIWYFVLVATSEENAKDSKVGFSRLTITIKFFKSLRRGSGCHHSALVND